MESAAQAPVLLEKKPRGRPKKQPETPILHRETVPEPEIPEPDEPEPSTEAAEAPPFPPIQPVTSFEVLSNYWNNILTAAQRQQGTVYVYRLFPKMKLVPGRGRMLVNANCEKFNEEDGPVTRDLIRTRRRMGTYLLRLNQRIVKPSCEICKCEVKIDGDITDANDMPILDVENLDVDDPGNKDYVRLLRSRGILKAVEGEGDDMAASEVLGNLAGRAIDVLSERNNQQQPAPVQVQSTNDGVGKELVGLLREQIQQNRPPEQQGTVGDHVKSLVDLAKSMTPPPMDLGPYVELQRDNNKLVQEMMRKDVERAEAAAARAMQEAEAYKAAMPKPKSLREELREMRELQQEYKVAISGKDPDDEDAKPEPATTAGFWGGFIGALPMLLDKGLEIMKQTNIMIFNAKLNGTGGPPLNPVTGQPGTGPVAPADDDEEQQTLSTEEQARINHMQNMQNVANQLTAVAQPMVEHLLRNATGADFAKFVIAQHGAMGINLIRSVPKETIAAMIQQYPPVWNQITQAQKVPQFQKFLDEFMGYSPVAVQ